METCLDLVLGANRSIDARTTFIFDATRRFGGKTSTGRKDFLFAPDCPASVVLPGVFSCHSGPALGPSASAEVPVPVAEMLNHESPCAAESTSRAARMESVNRMELSLRSSRARAPDLSSGSRKRPSAAARKDILSRKEKASAGLGSDKEVFEKMGLDKVLSWDFDALQYSESELKVVLDRVEVPTIASRKRKRDLFRRANLSFPLPWPVVVVVVLSTVGASLLLFCPEFCPTLFGGRWCRPACHVPRVLHVTSD